MSLGSPLSIDQLVVPGQFAPQTIASAPEALRYAEDATAASLAAARAGHLPVRVAYGADPAQRLDVFAAPAGEHRPVLLFLHGGAWIAGYPWWSDFMAPPLLARGFAFVSATYRLAPDHRFPLQLEDARAALSWVREHAREIGGDAERILIGGHSAGGHLAALATLTGPHPVRACLPVSAPFDLRYGNVSIDSPEGRVYKYLLARREDDAEASPMFHAPKARVPFHIVWGEKDFERIQRSGGAFVAALQAQGSAVSSLIQPGASHFDTHLALGDPASPWYGELARLAA